MGSYVASGSRRVEFYDHKNILTMSITATFVKYRFLWLRNGRTVLAAFINIPLRNVPFFSSIHARWRTTASFSQTRRACVGPRTKPTMTVLKFAVEILLLKYCTLCTNHVLLNWWRQSLHNVNRSYIFTLSTGIYASCNIERPFGCVDQASRNK